ncbi:hypothetical protein [Pedobacter rhizosphaerae]|uniref:Uncharacterized protein n=1 Tax=Pedobacter rhizosphaerae TaxID=390241 RepID=A0A1H9PQB9_9SPHI|nr:hypothetical protein [Pedobacter rhizosphaerae]SER50280.1 hypothetical protein SAMN04488023_11060 [Pedobacter rhizosphaerae]
MAISEYVKKAVFQLYEQFPASNTSGLNCLRFENAVDQFVDQLRITGAKVFVNKNDYYFSKAFGPISERLRDKTRKQIRKSLAFLRIREYSNYNFRAKVGVAEHAALLLSKEDMIQLQLINQGRFAKLYIFAEDILFNFAHARILTEQSGQSGGYYVSGPRPLAHTPFNMLRNIDQLTVYVIRKQKKESKARKVFL